jgi:hypothetical protein
VGEELPAAIIITHSVQSGLDHAAGCRFARQANVYIGCVVARSHAALLHAKTRGERQSIQFLLLLVR